MKITKFFSGLILFLVLIFDLNAAYTKKLYNPASKEKFKVSRSKIELFLKCPRCFYIDCRFGISQPQGFPFTLNNAVDALLKKEFDIYREAQKPHPLLVESKLDFIIPFKHEKIEIWRDALRAGIQYDVPETNLKITGGIDDIWINLKTKKILIVDYKATSKKGFISINSEWQNSYKRQVEIYQWLFRKNEFEVSNTAFFVYCNANQSVEKFDGCLNFDISLIPYNGNDSWVNEVIANIYKCLNSNEIPPSSKDCGLCRYINSRSVVLSKALKDKK